MDFVLAALPWHVIMFLRIKRKEKITIACGLSLGVLAGACSVVRTVELKTLSSMDNYVYDTAPMLLWSSSEVCLTIICACIPTLRPLYLRLATGRPGDQEVESYTLHESPHQRSYTLNNYSQLDKGNNRYDLEEQSEGIYVDKEIIVRNEPADATQGSTTLARDGKHEVDVNAGDVVSMRTA